jgi:L-methionine (R)-S-oxide reductase
METKQDKYELMLKQAVALLESESDAIANMANVAALLKDAFDFWWCGFYLVHGEELVLGPFQGPVACTRIAYGRGVCGSAWRQQRTIVVPDVELFPGHIACSSLSRSEIVVPVVCEDAIKGVLDIDSKSLNTFDAVDEQYLGKLVEIVAKRCFK